MEAVNKISRWDKVKRFLKITGTEEGELELREMKQQLIILMIAIMLILQIVGAWFFAKEMGWVSYAVTPQYDKNIAVLTIDKEITDPYINNIIGQLEIIKKQKESFPHLLIMMSSPGGAPQGSSELAHYLKDFQKEIDVTMYVQGIAASGAYYIASAINKDEANGLGGIIAQENSIVGSIGVIMPHMVYKDVADKIGIAQEDVTVGEFKKPISAFKYLTDKDEKYLKENLLGPVYKNFLNFVADGRGMTVDELKEYADGRIFVSTEVVGSLVDRISYATQIKNEVRADVEKRFPEEEVGFVPINLQQRKGSMFTVELNIENLQLGSDVTQAIKSNSAINLQ